MANILCVYENKIATVMGTEFFLNELKEYEPRINVCFSSIKKVTSKDLEKCDILYMIRPNNTLFGRIAKVAKRNGIFVVLYLDDDLMNLPKEIPNIPWRKKGLSFTISFSDMLISSSSHICSIYKKKYNISRVYQLDTPVNIKQIKMHFDNENDRMKIVYAAGLGHKVFFDKYITPILKKLDDKCGEKISLTFMGVHPEIDVNEYKMPISFIGALSLDEYRNRIEKENFDIGLAPLETTDFTKCKYFNKFIEYSMFGIVGLYANTEPYTFVVKDRINGLLVDNNPDCWYTAIMGLVNDNDLIKKCRDEAQKNLKERFNSTLIFDNLILNLPELIFEYRNREVRSSCIFLYKILYFPSRVADLLFKSFFYLRKGGVTELYSAMRRKLKVK